ncbi:MAG: hypothetical protein V5A59_04915, partial [Bacteroidales bacterium]
MEKGAIRSITTGGWGSRDTPWRVLLIDMKEINLAYTCEYEPTERREEEKRRRREDEWGEDKN